MQPTTTWQPFARGVYAALLALAALMVALGQPGTALLPTAAALALDPFDPLMRWAARPRWQHVWLIVHLAVVLALAVAAWR